MGTDFSPLTQNFLYCIDKDHKLLQDELGSSITQIYNANVCDEKIAAMFESRVRKHKYKLALGGTTPFKTAELTNGDYLIGVDPDGNKLFSFIQYMNAHCLSVAGSGAGKTTLSRFKILQIALNVRGLWLFDMKKKEFRVLKSYLKRIGIELIILPVRSLRINPLQVPEGVNLSDWVPRICNILAELLEMPPRASKLLQVELFKLYRKSDGTKGEYPTLFDLFESLKNNKDSNYQARVAILDNLEPVLLSLGPEVLGYRYGWSTSELAKHHIVFEFAGCSEVDKTLLLNTLVLSEFTSRIARGISNQKMDLMIFVDEAQRLCSSAAIADLIGLVRGTGIGLDLSLQSAYGLKPEIVSNTATKILGRCGSFSDYSSAGANMGLSSEMIHWAQLNLKPGTFIGQLGEGQWRHPFIFNVPAMDLVPSPDDVSCTDNPLPELPVIYADEFRNWPNSKQPVFNQRQEEHDRLFSCKQEYLFCKAVVDNPMKASSEYPKLAGISPNKAKDVREQLIAMNFIREHSLETGAKGRSTILLEAMPAGIQAVAQYGGEL